MALTRTQKEESVKELVNNISKAENIIVWEYHGTTAHEIADIRSNIKSKNGLNKVYKNRLAKIAFKESGKEEIMDILTGPNSFLFTFDNDEGSMKELANAVKANESLRFKGGYIEGQWYDADTVKEIANLPGKEDLLSMLLSVLEAPMRNLAYALSQVAEKAPAGEEPAPAEEAKAEEAPAEEASTEEASTEETPAEETPAEETTEEAKEEASEEENKEEEKGE